MPTCSRNRETNTYSQRKNTSHLLYSALQEVATTTNYRNDIRRQLLAKHVPQKRGVSKTLSPRTLLTGQTWSYTTHCKLEFGDYVETHEEHDNSMATRTIGAIALCPTGNTLGGYFFFSLATVRVLNRGRWTSLPMPNEVIDRVHRMACQEHGNNALRFEDRDHNPLANPDDDGDDDSTYHPEEDDNGDDSDDNGDDNSDGGDENDDDDPGPPDVPHEGQPITNHLPENVDIDNNDNNDQEPGPVDNIAENVDELPTHRQEEEAPTENDEELMPNNRDKDQVASNNDMGTPTIPNDPTLPPRARRELNRLATDGVGPTIYQGRTRSQTRQQQHTMTTTAELEGSTPLPYHNMTDFEKELFHRRVTGVRVPSEIGYDQHETLRHTILTQYTLKKGLQVFGPPGIEAVYKDLKQLHERKVGEPRDASTLSPTQMRNALGYLMFLKQK